MASAGKLTSANLSAGAEWSVDDLFFQLMHLAEKTMKPDRLYILTDYPPFQAAYARIGVNGWAARFEVYWKGMELANAFWEVTDPDVQRERFQRDIQKKISEGKSAVPMDEEFLNYMKSGKFPESSGIALGLERLFMAIFDINDIQALNPFIAK
ncbi:MAG: amino acid--tRNA ligase-related protein [Bdellovibrionota bacterium]